jgi:hypothetical protein
MLVHGNFYYINFDFQFARKVHIITSFEESLIPLHSLIFSDSTALLNSSQLLSLDHPKLSYDLKLHSLYSIVFDPFIFPSQQSSSHRIILIPIFVIQ